MSNHSKPAYPSGLKWTERDHWDGVRKHEKGPFHAGMTLREHFAARAMQGLLSDTADIDVHPTRIARLAVECADALIAELAETTPS